MKKHPALVALLCVCALAKDNPAPLRVCLRIDDNIQKIVGSRWENFKEVSLQPYKKQKLDASICPVEKQPIEVRYSVDVLRSKAKTIYKTEIVPGGAITTPEEIPAQSMGFWHIRLYVGQDSGEVCGGFDKVDECSERVAKTVRKMAKQLKASISGPVGSPGAPVPLYETK